MQQVTFKSKSVYGNTLYYPTCPMGQALVNMVNAKTLTPMIERYAAGLNIQIVKID